MFSALNNKDAARCCCCFFHLLILQSRRAKASNIITKHVRLQIPSSINIYLFILRQPYLNVIPLFVFYRFDFVSSFFSYTFKQRCSKTINNFVIWDESRAINLRTPTFVSNVSAINEFNLSEWPVSLDSIAKTIEKRMQL